MQKFSVDLFSWIGEFQKFCGHKFFRVRKNSAKFVKVNPHTVFGKTMENVKKHRDIKLVTTEATRNFVVSEPNYHTKKKKILKIYQLWK